MKPMPDKHPKQAQVLRDIREDFKARPTESLFLIGESGAGKSAILFAIYQDEVRKAERPAFAATLDEALESYKQWEFTRNTNNPTTPIIDPEYLEYCGRKDVCCLVCIDEISAEKPTEYKLQVFFKIVKACHDNRHQLIVTSNYDEDGLVTLWSVDGMNARPLIRRLVDEAEVFEFPFEGTKEYEKCLASISVGRT